jgi:hypothetical protein
MLVSGWAGEPAALHAQPIGRDQRQPGTQRQLQVDVLELRIARLKNAHPLNTAAMLIGLAEAAVEPEARQILKSINEMRKSPMRPVDRPARTKKV